MRESIYFSVEFFCFRASENFFSRASKKVAQYFISSIFEQIIFFVGAYISLESDDSLHVVLTFNQKPEFPAFSPSVSSSLHAHTSAPTAIDDRYAEWDSPETIDAVAAALSTHHTVTRIEADDMMFERFKECRPDIVFNIAEGFYGISREAQVPAVLDMLNIPYTGSDTLALATCLDKARTKEILTYHGVPNAKFVVAHAPEDVRAHSLRFPLIVKPVGEGSSKGIFSSSFVRDDGELRAEVSRVLDEYSQSALIEEFLPGREFTVAMLGNGSTLQTLPIVEILYNGFPEDFVPLYSYEAKWILDEKENPLDVFQCPARIPRELEEQIVTIAKRTFNILRCRDWSRIDVRLDDKGIPSIIEINPLPGILPDPRENSCYPKAARTAGLDYNSMLLAVLDAARKRYGI